MRYNNMLALKNEKHVFIWDPLELGSENVAWQGKETDESRWIWIAASTVAGCHDTSAGCWCGCLTWATPLGKVIPWRWWKRLELDQGRTHSLTSLYFIRLDGRAVHALLEKNIVHIDNMCYLVAKWGRMLQSGRSQKHGRVNSSQVLKWCSDNNYLLCLHCTL